MVRWNDTILEFFNSFEMDSDVERGHYYKAYISNAIFDFIKSNTKDEAFNVYQTFLDCYREKLQGKKSFIDLLDTLRKYEENASTLIDKQRDHYVHSVNVFLLGLYIFQSNDRFKTIFKEYSKKHKYEGAFIGDTEEFFFQWGFASLFHDIGYPVEITNNQLKKFIGYVVDYGDIKKIDDAKPYIGYKNYQELCRIPISQERAQNYAKWMKDGFNPLNSIDLLSYSLASAFSLDYKSLQTELSNYVGNMQNSGFVDHGFYSALIVMRWYAHFAEDSNMHPDLLYYPILNSASAILLHNYYKNVLEKPPYSLPPMSASLHPIAYMLILCDELQEWNREAYGILDRQKVLAADSDLEVSNQKISVHYITFEGTLSEDFATKKAADLNKLLNFKEIFEGNITVTATTKTDLYIANMTRKEVTLLPRPFLENIETLAKMIHAEYNKNQLLTNPDKPLEYPDWDSLPDSLKYSNVRQARAYFDKIEKLGFIALPKSNNERQITSFTQEQIEILARDEHNSWFEERMGNGWIYGEKKDAVRKTSPYMKPYDELTEKIKELDRDAVRNIIPLLSSVGLNIYER